MAFLVIWEEIVLQKKKQKNRGETETMLLPNQGKMYLVVFTRLYL